MDFKFMHHSLFWLKRKRASYWHMIFTKNRKKIAEKYFIKNADLTVTLTINGEEGDYIVPYEKEQYIDIDSYESLCFYEINNAQPQKIKNIPDRKKYKPIDIYDEGILPDMLKRIREMESVKQLKVGEKSEFEKAVPLITVAIAGIVFLGGVWLIFG